jgi:RNA polymerase sigma-70 factor, ECF subfamily
MQKRDLLRFIDGLYAYAMAITRNRNDAEHLVQETYVRAFRRMGSLQAGSNLKSWLFTILRNTHLKQLRKQRSAPESTLDFAVETTKDPLATEREWVADAVQQLPSEFREIVVLRECEGLSYQEIAVILDCPVGTVMSRLARARSRLRTTLMDMGQAVRLGGIKDRRGDFARIFVTRFSEIFFFAGCWTE